MPSVLCELSDSIIDLNTSNDLHNDVTSHSDDCVTNEHHTDNITVVVDAQELLEDNAKMNIDHHLIYPSKPAETFTINFDPEEMDEVDSGSVAVSRFVPSKLRASFEERDKTKRTKPQPLKTSNKIENPLPKTAENCRISKTNNKTPTTNSQNGKTTNLRANSKTEEKVALRTKDLSNKTKTIGVDRPTKTKAIGRLQKQSTPNNEPIEKVPQIRPVNISCHILNKKTSKSYDLEKMQTEDDFISPKTKSVKKAATLPTLELTSADSNSVNCSQILSKRRTKISKDKDVVCGSHRSLDQAHSSAASSINNSKCSLPGSIPVTEEAQSLHFSHNSYNNEQHTLSNSSRKESTESEFSATNIICPTLSKKNSKSYLLEKMLMGDEELSRDFLAYEESKSDCVIIEKEKSVDVHCKIHVDQQGSIDNLSETGTYVIEECADDKTVDLYESDDTLAKDNSSSVSSHRLNSRRELESKSSGKWLSEFPDDDVTVNCDVKNKRNISSKFTGTSMPHIPNDDYFATNKRDNYRDDDHSKSNYNCLVTDNRHRGNRNSNSRSIDDDNNNKRNCTLNTLDTQQQYDSNLQNAYSSYSNISYSMGNQSMVNAEDLYVPDVGNKSTVPSNSCNQVSSLQHKLKDHESFTPTQVKIKHHPRPTFSVASLDTALLLQDTEALLNDMEKRVYSRKDKRDETSKSQTFSANMSHGEKIPFVDEADEKEEDSSLFSYPTETEETVRMGSIKPTQPITFNEQAIIDEKNRSYTVRSPMNTGNIRRNNSCKLGISESMTLSRKLNSTLRNQRSCSMIEEQRLNHASMNNNMNNMNNNSELFNDYRSKSKPSVLAMNSGIFLNRRGSAGISSALNSPVSRLEPGSIFNNGFSNVQRSKDVFPYFSTNLLSLHRQRFNRYEYGQHSLKYNSNSTTMLYSKYNNTSPPWNGEEPIVSPSSFYPTYDTDYYAYNTMPEPLDASMLLSKHDHNIINNNSHVHISNLDLNPDMDYNKREDIGEYSQPCNASGRSSAFSPVNSLHQSTESVNNYQMASKSRSSIGLNEQRNCGYDILLVSSVHQYSARLCRYTEEIVHRMRREGSDYQNNSPADTVFDQSDSFGQIKSVNRELQETVSNLRSLEKQLQKVERLIFPIEKSGRNSTAGSCTEDNYLNQLERINKELKDFVPIDDPVAGTNKSSTAKLTVRGDYAYLTTTTDTKESSQANQKSMGSKDKVSAKSRNNEPQLEPSEVRSTPKSKYSSISKRFQHRKD